MTYSLTTNAPVRGCCGMPNEECCCSHATQESVRQNLQRPAYTDRSGAKYTLAQDGTWRRWDKLQQVSNQETDEVLPLPGANTGDGPVANMADDEMLPLPSM